MNAMLEQAAEAIIHANAGAFGVSAGWIAARISGSTPLGIETACARLAAGGRIERTRRYGIDFWHRPARS